MLKKITNVLSLIFARIIPLGVITYEYAYIEESKSLDFTMMGWTLIVLILYLAWYKPFKEKVKVWEIQDSNEFIVQNFKHLRVIFVFTIFYFTVNIIGLNINDLKGVLFYILLSLLLGWVLKILSIEYNKKESTV
jgi:hypothetical protein